MSGPDNVSVYQCANGLFGSEEHVAIRRQMVLLSERMTNHILPRYQMIESGSLAEGIRYPLSDSDKMIYQISQHVIEDFSNRVNAGDLLMIPTTPGFCLLIDVTHSIPQNDIIFVFGMPVYSSTLMKENKRKSGEIIHGPSRTMKTAPIDFDLVDCIKCSSWPNVANEWVKRTRVHGWPNSEIIEDIVANGCHVVPVGNHRLSRNTKFGQRGCHVLEEESFQLSDHEWRLSFSLAERHLMHSLNHVQFIVYGLLWLILKRVIPRPIENLLCSYFMKTILFITLENSGETPWCVDGLEECYQKCISFLLEAIDSNVCPNYFVRECNMFQNRFDSSNRISLRSTINEIKRSRALGLITICEVDFFTNSLIDKRFIEMELDTGVSEFFLSRVIVSITSYIQFSELTGNLTMKSSLERMREMIYENEVFRRNEMQDFLATIAEKYFIHYLIDRMNRPETRTYTHSQIGQIIETLLRDQKDGDASTKPLTMATYMYLNGDIKSAVPILEKLISECPSYRICDSMLADSKIDYMKRMCGRGYTIGYKLRKSLTPFYGFKTSSLFAAPFPLRLWLVVGNSLVLDPITYAYFLLSLCEKDVKNHQSIDKLNRQLTKWKDPYRIAEIKMCLGILENIYGRNEKSFQWFYSVYLTADIVNAEKLYDYSLISLMHIACLIFKCLNSETLYQRMQGDLFES